MSFRGLTEADGPEGERPLPAPAEELEYVLLDLDGDGGAELVVQMVAQPTSSTPCPLWDGS